ncbi:hypothetical protein P8452_57567 [Trifolium repens]|nr:hypothetical protein P8452_57567 [Trifolium repens]
MCQNKKLSSNECVVGKRVQKDVGGKALSKLLKRSSSPRKRSIRKVEGKPLQEDVGDRVPNITQSEPPKMFELVEGKLVGVSYKQMTQYYSDPDYYWLNSEYKKNQNSIHPNHPDPCSNRDATEIILSRKFCGCRRYYDDNDGSFDGYLDALDMLVPAFVWPFLDNMAAKSDDKTLLLYDDLHSYLNDINTVDHDEDGFMVIACDGIWLSTILSNGIWSQSFKAREK